MMGFAALMVLAGTGPFSAGLVDELEPLYPDSTVAGLPARMEIDAARGTFAGVHVLLEGLAPGRRVEMRGGAPEARWYRLVDVPVEVNTGTDGRTEKLNNKTNPDVIRRAPFRVYDALQPLDGGFDAPAATAAVRFEVWIPRDAEPGTRTLRLAVRHEGAERRLAVVLHIREAVVPPVGRDSLGYTNWWSIGNVATYHGTEPWSERYWEVLGRYADLMARSRQNTILVPWASFVERDGDRFRLDRARLRRFVELFTARDIHWLEGGHFAGRENNDWMAKRFVLNLTGSPVGEPKGRAELKALADELDAAIRAEGWQKRWLQHLADEPIDVNVEDYAQMAAEVQLRMPLIPIFEATMSRRLVGAVDAWCPQIHEFQHNRAWFSERQADRDRVWVYTCLSPTGPWLNRLLDMERLRPVYIGWAAAAFDLDGFLHWGFNYWRGDPYRQSVVRHTDAPENDAMALPAGDTHVAYPGPDGPWSGTRLEAQRIGMEDAEMLRKLKRRDPARFAAVIAPVFRAADDYSKSVADYRRARRALMEAFEDLR